MTKNIVVLGAGFGGLRAARQIYKSLKKSALLENYKIRLIDKNNFHTFTPLLYETATTSKQTADNLKLKSLIAYPLSELLRNKKIEFLQGEVEKVDFVKALVQLKNSELKFDYLVLALR
ncbi:MAG: FAD-dependent oxidoreductase [Patescibacteria group bacterium]